MKYTYSHNTKGLVIIIDNDNNKMYEIEEIKFNNIFNSDKFIRFPDEDLILKHATYCGYFNKEEGFVKNWNGFEFERNNNIEDLQLYLNDILYNPENENYEDYLMAASIRDKIKSIEDAKRQHDMEKTIESAIKEKNYILADKLKKQMKDI